MGGIGKANWAALKSRAVAGKDRSILELLDAPDRAESFSISAMEMLFDYSKTSLTPEDRAFLIGLYEAAGVAKRRDAMFSGAPINETEGRAVLHTALRNPGVPVLVDGRDVAPDVEATLARMERFAETLRDSSFAGAGGRFTDVVNIGIGGSDLGPAMAVQALANIHDGPRCHFVSNIDGAHIADTLKGLDPRCTLVIVASKTFTTIETITNAQTARDWIAERVDSPGDQFAALSSATDKAGAFGIAPDRVFGFEDWVGGRYSIWGPIGLALMIAIGPKNFRAFLAGGAAMGAHFRDAEPLENLPVMLALIGIWHNQGQGFSTRAVLPYDQRLARLPAYLQQLEMESNGKSVAMDGTSLEVNSGPIVWGEPGTTGQHAFYQLIHQGTRVVPCEFLMAAEGHEPHLAHQHALLVANCLAQSEALMRGRSFEEAHARMADAGLSGTEQERQARHRVFSGNRPSVTLLYPRLTPFVLGQIIALYEHRVFVEGAMLGINSFDQWGVELGKELATALGPMVRGEAAPEGKDASTQGLLAYIRAHQG